MNSGRCRRSRRTGISNASRTVASVRPNKCQPPVARWSSQPTAGTMPQHLVVRIRRDTLLTGDNGICQHTVIRGGCLPGAIPEHLAWGRRAGEAQWKSTTTPGHARCLSAAPAERPWAHCRIGHLQAERPGWPLRSSSPWSCSGIRYVPMVPTRPPTLLPTSNSGQLSKLRSDCSKWGAERRR